MSGLIHPTVTGMPQFRAADKACLDSWWFDPDRYPVVLRGARRAEEEDIGYVSPWWPQQGNLLGGIDGVPENQILSVAPWYARPWLRSGANGRLGFVGFTRDQYGSIIPNCTVRCFRTGTNELVSSVTSDANGAYIATTPYSDAHYLVVHATGVAGASLNTVTPA